MEEKNTIKLSSDFLEAIHKTLLESELETNIEDVTECMMGAVFSSLMLLGATFKHDSLDYVKDVVSYIEKYSKFISSSIEGQTEENIKELFKKLREAAE